MLPPPMLGCAVAGMGISLLPRKVLSTFPGANLLSIHSLPPALGRDQTLLIWRKGVVSPKIRALKELLLEHSDLRKRAPAKRRGANGHAAVA